MHNCSTQYRFVHFYLKTVSVTTRALADATMSKARLPRNRMPVMAVPLMKVMAASCLGLEKESVLGREISETFSPCVWVRQDVCV